MPLTSISKAALLGFEIQKYNVRLSVALNESGSMSIWRLIMRIKIGHKMRNTLRVSIFLLYVKQLTENKHKFRFKNLRYICANKSIENRHLLMTGM